MDGTNNNHNGMNFGHPGIQQYQERLGRFQPDGAFSTFSFPVSRRTCITITALTFCVALHRINHSYDQIFRIDDMHPYMGHSPTGIFPSDAWCGRDIGTNETSTV